MEEIRMWYNGNKNYNEGVLLYLKYGKDLLLRRLFQEKPATAFKEKKLLESLQALITEKHPPVTKVVESSPVNTVITPTIKATESKWQAADLNDKVINTYYLQWKEKYNLMLHLQARIESIAEAGLKDPNKEEEACRMALEILDLDDACDEVYKLRDYYKENKKEMPNEAPVEISKDPAQWHKKLENHQKYERTFRRKLEKDPSNTSYAELIKKHEWAIVEYKKLLKMI